MRLNLKATNLELTPNIRDYLDKRLLSIEKLLDFNDPSVMVDVELGRTTRHHQTGDIFFAEINIHRGKEAFRAVSDRPDILSAIDDVRDEIARELSSKKGKLRVLSRRGGQLAKAILKGSFDGLGYLGRPAKAGWRYLRRVWRRN